MLLDSISVSQQTQDVTNVEFGQICLLLVVTIVTNKV